jgi:hypothetical protein
MKQPTVYKYEDITYVRLSEIYPVKDRKAFGEFMFGQTVPLVPGLIPQDAFYSWDYENYLRFRRGGLAFWD